MFWSVLLIIPLLSLCDSYVDEGFRDAANGGSARIIGGLSSSQGQFPWQVHLSMFLPGRPRPGMCGGVVKNATHIITAAHCISAGVYPSRPREGMRIRVRAGGLRLDSCDPLNQQDREVKRAWVHPYYRIEVIPNIIPEDTDCVNDAALLELAEPLDLNENIKPISMPEPYEEILRTDCAISGWGLRNVGGSVSHYLQYLPVRTLHWTQCQKNISNFREAMVCVRGEGPRGACNGDSGGPLACPLVDNSDSVLVGIASFIMVPCGSGINADGYVGVSHHLDIYNGVVKPFDLVYEDPKQAVLGGWRASKGQYPWFALIEVFNSNGNLVLQCAGAVISASHVLTAASCFRGEDTLVTVTAGLVKGHICENFRQSVQADKILIHQSNVNEGENNVALLYLRTPFTLTEYVNVVDLPNSRDFNLQNANCTMLGFGKDEKNNDSALSNSVLQVSVNANSVADIGACRSTSSGGRLQPQASGPHVCSVVKEGAQGQCHGNMGSPLVCNITTECGRRAIGLAGILGWRPGCNANMPYLFSGPNSINELLDGKGKSYSLKGQPPILPLPPTEIGNMKLPRIGEGEYCAGDPFEGVPNITRPSASTPIPRYMGAKVVADCAIGTQISMSTCGSPLRKVTIQCGYDNKLRGRWIVTSSLCKGVSANIGGNEDENGNENGNGNSNFVKLNPILAITVWLAAIRFA